MSRLIPRMPCMDGLMASRNPVTVLASDRISQRRLCGGDKCGLPRNVMIMIKIVPSSPVRSSFWCLIEKIANALPSLWIFRFRSGPFNLQHVEHNDHGPRRGRPPGQQGTNHRWYMLGFHCYQCSLCGKPNLCQRLHSEEVSPGRPFHSSEHCKTPPLSVSLCPAFAYRWWCSPVLTIEPQDLRIYWN